MQDEQNCAVVLKEKVNNYVAHFLQFCTPDEFHSYSANVNSKPKSESEMDQEYKKLQRFLASIVGKDSVERTYDFARGKKFGRMYCSSGIQNVSRAVRGALCKGCMTDIDIKNAHPSILLYVCDLHGIPCSVLAEYVHKRDFHLKEMSEATGKEKNVCKRLFLIVTNSNESIDGVRYKFFNDFQTEILSIQEALMQVSEFQKFRPYAAAAAAARSNNGRSNNEEGSFINLVMCYFENIFIQDVRLFLESKGLEVAVLMFDGVMVNGDCYGNLALLDELHELLFRKHKVKLFFDYKAHDTSILDRIPDDFDPTMVLGEEWNMKIGILSNINDCFLKNDTHMRRIMESCYGQGKKEDRKITWRYAAERLWLRSGRTKETFNPEWKSCASQMTFHNANTLRHYSRESNKEYHGFVIRKSLGLNRTTTFNEVQLRDYFVKIAGDSIVCIDKQNCFFVWDGGSWRETGGELIAEMILQTVCQLFAENLRYWQNEVNKLVAQNQGTGDEATNCKQRVEELGKTQYGYGNGKNQNVLALVKQHLRFDAMVNDPFDMETYHFAFTNISYDLRRKRSSNGFFIPDKYDFMKMSCQKPWVEPTAQEVEKVREWFVDIFPDPELRRAYTSILKSGLSGKRFEYFFVATGDGCNGKGLLNEHFIYLLDLNGYAVIGHLDLLTSKIKSGANTEARSLHKKRFVRFSEPCPGVDMEAIRLSNVNELTGNEQLKARTLHEKDDDTRLHSTSMLECNDPPACVGDKGNSSQRRWRFIPFQVTFTDDPQLIAKDGVLFKKKDETLKDDGAKKRYYCALFQYLISAENVWEPDDCLDDYMPDITKQRARDYLMKNDELSSWFCDQYKEKIKIDSGGHIVNFLSIKEIMAHYQTCSIYQDMNKADRRKFNDRKLKEEIEKNPILKIYFREAKKVRLSKHKGGYNTQHGIIHFELRTATDGDESDDDSMKRQRMG